MILVFRADVYDLQKRITIDRYKLRKRFGSMDELEIFRKDQEHQKSDQYQVQCAIHLHLKDMGNSEIISLMALLESRSYTLAKVEKGHHLVVMIGDQIYRDTQPTINKLAAPLGRWLISISNEENK